MSLKEFQSSTTITPQQEVDEVTAERNASLLLSNQSLSVNHDTLAVNSAEVQEVQQNRRFREASSLGLAFAADRTNSDQELVLRALQDSSIASYHVQAINRLLQEYQRYAQTTGEAPLFATIQVLGEGARAIGERLALLQYPQDLSSGLASSPIYSIDLFLDLDAIQASSRHPTHPLYLEEVVHNELLELHLILQRSLEGLRAGLPAPIAFGIAYNEMESGEAIRYAIDYGLLSLLPRSEAVSNYTAAQRLALLQQEIGNLREPQISSLLETINQLAAQASSRYDSISQRFEVSPTETPDLYTYRWIRNNEVLVQGVVPLNEEQRQALRMSGTEPFLANAQDYVQQGVEMQLRLYGLDKYYQLAPWGGSSSDDPAPRLIPMLVPRAPELPVVVR